MLSNWLFSALSNTTYSQSELSLQFLALLSKSKYSRVGLRGGSLKMAWRFLQRDKMYNEVLIFIKRIV